MSPGLFDSPLDRLPSAGLMQDSLDSSLVAAMPSRVCAHGAGPIAGG